MKNMKKSSSFQKEDTQLGFPTEELTEIDLFFPPFGALKFRRLAQNCDSWDSFVVTPLTRTCNYLIEDP
jgi:hypothetical protein